MPRLSQFPRAAIPLLIVCLFALPLGSSLHGGIGGAQVYAGPDGDVPFDDVAKSGCLCHNAVADNSVQIILDDVPYAYIAGETYTMRLQIIGGPPATGTYTAGFSMRVTLGELSGDGLQNWNDDVTSLTHTEGSADEANREWVFDWTAPAEDSGVVSFWITGNSVNGDLVPGVEDKWNQLQFSLQEGSTATTSYGKRMLFAGDGNVSPPEPDDHGVDLHHMGAKLRAHWLGLLGFGAVLAVVLFAGLLLRYGFSTSYKGRSNQLRLRYKLMRRGDQ